MWSAVGSGLALVGLGWLSRGERVVAAALLAAGLAVGWAKGRWVLERVARRNAERILRSGERLCLGGAFSWSAWGAAVGFSVLGAALRRSTIPSNVLGAVYVAAGAGLLLASRVAWAHWWRQRAASGGTASHT